MNCGQIADPCPDAVTGSAAQLFFTLINALMVAKCPLGPAKKYPPDYGPSLTDRQEFDFIVVGAGSAGSIVGARLSEITEWDVLVLEAGTYPSAAVEIPLLVSSVIGSSEDWRYRMQPGNYCKSLKGNICTCPRGKVLGGSSDLNGMVYIRGNKRDYSKWATESNAGWSYESVLRHYRGFENVQDQDGNEYGRNGELEITRYMFDQPLRDIIIKGFGELGYSQYREELPLGYLDSYVTIYQGTRNNAAKAFLGKAKGRRNLKLAVNAQVSRVLVDPQTKTAYAVEVKINGTLFVLKARKEVILSAGAIASPQILLHSGIGPRDVLKPLGIDVVRELDVGENMQDHFIFPFSIALKPSALYSKSQSDAITDIYDYFIARQGPYGTSGLLNFLGFVNTKNNSIYPNIQTMVHVASKNDASAIIDQLRLFNQPNEVVDALLSENKQNAILVVLIILLNPQSRGKILINGTNPFDYPLIYPNYLSDAEDQDIQTELEGIRWMEKLLTTKAFKKYDAKIIKFDIPNCKRLEYQSDDYWKCLMRNIGAHVFHQTGTCKMGSARDPRSVVDPQLKVRGLKGLRVIDASIMPFITSGNTNAPTIMIGAKGAAMVVDEHMSVYGNF